MTRNLSPISIAMADDHTLLLKALAKTLSAVPDFNVIIMAENGKELIEQTEQAATLPDICLLDIKMPEMNGYDTAAVFKKRWPSVKVLALSMYIEEYPIINMLCKGACGFIAKDVEPTELIEAIRFTVAHGFYHDGVIKSRFPNGIMPTSILPDITIKEKEFLSLCCTSYSYKEIAGKMLKSPHTIENYRDRLFNKLNVHSRSELVLFAVLSGMH